MKKSINFTKFTLSRINGLTNIVNIKSKILVS